jgi:hypothetical protein
MAKQNFTTGQILTANQMLDLQQTAMGGGAATAKTASYVLVAADAGSTVAMNAAGATTITVNTALFAAGDTVFIQNLGAGLCTVTAGTATVSTAGSLILPQYDAGILYFTSASTAIFYDYIQTGATSPLTTKGDLYTFGTSDTRLGVGANGTTLVADSAEATGLKWATPASGGGMTLISTTTLTGASVSLTSIPQTYNDLHIVIQNFKPANDGAYCNMRLNNDSTSNRYRTLTLVSANMETSLDFNNTSFHVSSANDNSVATGLSHTRIYNYTNSTTWKMADTMVISTDNSTTANFQCFQRLGVYNQTGAITEINILPNSGNFTSGTVLLYGVK